MSKSRKRDPPESLQYVDLLDRESGELIETPVSASGVTNNTDEKRLAVIELGPHESVRKRKTRPPGKTTNSPLFTAAYINELQAITNGLDKNGTALLFHIMVHLDFDGYASVPALNRQQLRLDVSGCKSLLDVGSTTVNKTLDSLEDKRVVLRESQGNHKWIRVNPLYLYRGSRGHHNKACEAFNDAFNAEMVHRGQQRKRGRRKAGKGVERHAQDSNISFQGVR